MANLPTEDPGTHVSLLRERVPLFAAFGRADDALYSVERVIVTASLIIMTLSSFLKVLSDFLEKLPQGSPFYLLATLVLLIVARVATGNSPTLKDNRMKANLFALLGGLLGGGFIWVVGTFSSAIVVIICVLTAGGMLVTYTLEDARGPEGLRITGGTLWKLAVTLAASVAGVWVGATLDSGYSWAPNISLTLLLWMAFLGASMATHEGRHLAVDAVRKLVKPERERLFNAASLAMSAIVTSAFLYLAVIYLAKRVGETPEPGKIPDWIKVLSIPVSLAFMTLRFSCYAMAEAVGAKMGIPPEPKAETEVQG